MMLISFFTVRLVLQALGEVNYGIYSIVGGVVGMLGFLSGAMAVGNQRFFSFYIGKGDEGKLKSIFSSTLAIYAILIIAIVVICETVGLWFVNYKLVYPPERTVAVNWIYQFSIISTAISLYNAPYIAAIISHEDMKIFARYGILDVVLKVVVVALLLLTPFDRLITYSALWLGVTILMFFIYQHYCRRHYAECRVGIHFYKDELKEIASFNAWNLFGNFAWMIKNQGIGIVLNIFFGPVLNAAQQLASTVRTTISSFAQNFSVAVRPQITKDYAQANYQPMFLLSFRSMRVLFSLMAILSLPLIFNMEFALKIWLGEVPEYTVIFSQLLVIETIIEVTSTPLATINQATGKIKWYQMTIGILGVLNLPASYVLLRWGFSPTWVFVVSVFFEALIVLTRLLFLWRIDAAMIGRCLADVFLRCGIAAGIAYVACLFIEFREQGLFMTLTGIVMQVIATGLICYLLVMPPYERKKINNFVVGKAQKVFSLK